MTFKKEFSRFFFLWVVLLLPYLSACGIFSRTEADAQPTAPRSGQQGGMPAVEVAIARTGVVQDAVEYIGTTRPVREVSLRAQAEGRLLNLPVGVGDRVRRGQIVAQLDDSLLITQVSQAQAELGALQSEVARAQTQVSNARARAEQARVELNQARLDASRRQTLGQQGAIPQQEVELAQTAAQTAEQNWRAALDQISTEQKAVAAAQGRVAAQRATVAQAKERQSYALIASPINGVVLEQLSEPGNLVQPGGEVLRLGDFSQVQVVVPVSELEVSNIQPGQAVQVRLDAFANQEFTGTVTRISPSADATARQLPVEITIENSNGRMGSGLLARVSFQQTSASRVVVPQTALQEQGSRGAGVQESRGARGQGGNRNSAPANSSLVKEEQSSPSSDSQASATVFVVTGDGNQAKVQARQVQLGNRANGNVEILSGLQPGERFVARSGRPLKDGEAVRLSILSET